MTFKEHRDKLQAKKYRPLPQAELNALVISGDNPTKVVDSCQRLVIKAMSKYMHFDVTPDDMLFEFVQVCNAALAEAMNLYKEDKIDFAYFAYVHMQNAVKHYIKFNSNTVKSSIVQGERQDASYLYLSDDKEDFDIEYQRNEELFSVSPKKLFELIKSEHHLFKPYYMDVYAAYIGLDGNGGKKVKEIAEEFEISGQRVSQIIKDVENKMKSNEKILAYLAEF